MIWWNPLHSPEKPSATWGPFLEPPHNLPGPKAILGAQYSPIAIQFLLILKLHLNLYNFVKHIARFAAIIAISWHINDLEKILTGPGKLSGVSRNWPLVPEVLCSSLPSLHGSVSFENKKYLPPQPGPGNRFEKWPRTLFLLSRATNILLVLKVNRKKKLEYLLTNQMFFYQV